MKPREANSAQRKIVRVRLGGRRGKLITAYIQEWVTHYKSIHEFLYDVEEYVTFRCQI